MKTALSLLALPALALATAGTAAGPGLAAVERDIAALRRDLSDRSAGAEAALQVGNPGGRGIGGKVQVTVDLFHCRHLKMIETIDGKDSEAYRTYLQQVYDAQRQMKPNFQIIALLEKIRSFGRSGSARLTEEHSEMTNPCDHVNGDGTRGDGDLKYGTRSGEKTFTVEGDYGISPKTGLPYVDAQDRRISISMYKLKYKNADTPEDKEVWASYLCEVEKCPEGFTPTSKSFLDRAKSVISDGFKKLTGN
jgi:hypothetical protein